MAPASVTRSLLGYGVLVGPFYLAVGMIAAAFFPTDPIDGFPPGTPLGVPATMSVSGLVQLLSESLSALRSSC